MEAILGAGATLPSLFYTEPGIAELEDELVFRPSWQIVGIEPELRNVGDYFTTDIAGYGFAGTDRRAA
jgi:choline monooxygenase